jgi:hypothetical protein
MDSLFHEISDFAAKHDITLSQAIELYKLFQLQEINSQIEAINNWASTFYELMERQ